MSSIGFSSIAFAALAFGSLWAGCGPAEATPYDTLSSIAGNYNVFLTGNLGSAGAPFTRDPRGPGANAGNAALNGVGGVRTDPSGQVGGNVFVGDAQTNLSSGVVINGSLNPTGAISSLNAGGDGGAPFGVYATASTQMNDQSYWTAARTSGGPSTPSTPLDLFGDTADVLNAANSLTALSETTTVSVTDGAISMALTKNGINVVDLSVANGATITGIAIANPNGVTPTGLIVNVAGDNVIFGLGSYDLGPLSPSATVFNFGNATTLTLRSLAFNGATLAPLATIDLTSGQLNRALIANNYVSSATLSFDPLRLGFPAYAALVASGASSAPEPSALALFFCGLVALALWRRGPVFKRVRR